MGEIALGLLTGGWNLIKMGFAAVGDFLGKLDGRGLVELVASLLALALIAHFAMDARHWRKQDARDVTALKVEKANGAKVAKQATDLKAKIDAQGVTISNQKKELVDAENARIDADAATLRVSGPGKAACARNAVIPSASGGHGQAAANPDAAGAALPPVDGADVSWNWLTTRAQEHDELLTEDKAWRDWYAQIVKAWPK